jgi:hypothetical protein
MPGSTTDEPVPSHRRAREALAPILSTSSRNCVVDESSTPPALRHAPCHLTHRGGAEPPARGMRRRTVESGPIRKARGWRTRRSCDLEHDRPRAATVRVEIRSTRANTPGHPMVRRAALCATHDLERGHFGATIGGETWGIEGNRRDAKRQVRGPFVLDVPGREGAPIGLENRWRGDPSVGSNPTPPAPQRSRLLRQRRRWTLGGLPTTTGSSGLTCLTPARCGAFPRSGPPFGPAGRGTAAR